MKNDNFYQAVAEQISISIDDNWVFANVEIDVEMDALSIIGQYKNDEGDFKNFIVNDEIINLFEELYDQMAADNKTWKKALFELHDNGKFTLNFEYTDM